MSSKIFKNFKFFKDKFSRLVFSASHNVMRSNVKRSLKTNALQVSKNIDALVKNMKNRMKFGGPVRQLGWLLKPARTMEKDLPSTSYILRNLKKGSLVRRGFLDSSVSNGIYKGLSTGTDAGRFIASKMLYKMKAIKNANRKYTLSIMLRNHERIIKNAWYNSINHWRY